MQTQNKLYSDFDLNFVAHPTSGNLQVLTGPAAVKQSVKILVLNQYYERFHQPYLGSNLKYYLFENVDQVTALLIRDEIERVILANELRVKNLTVQVKPDFDRNGFIASIVFSVINIQIPVTIDLFLTRTR